MTPSPTRPDLCVVFRDTCTCHADGRRDNHCPNHAQEDDE